MVKKEVREGEVVPKRNVFLVVALLILLLVVLFAVFSRRDVMDRPFVNDTTNVFDDSNPSLLEDKEKGIIITDAIKVNGREFRLDSDVVQDFEIRKEALGKGGGSKINYYFKNKGEDRNLSFIWKVRLDERYDKGRGIPSDSTFLLSESFTLPDYRFELQSGGLAAYILTFDDMRDVFGSVTLSYDPSSRVLVAESSQLFVEKGQTVVMDPGFAPTMTVLLPDLANISDSFFNINWTASDGDGDALNISCYADTNYAGSDKILTCFEDTNNDGVQSCDTSNWPEGQVFAIWCESDDSTLRSVDYAPGNLTMLHNNSWPAFRGDVFGSGFRNKQVNVTNLTLLWKFETGASSALSGVVSSPVVSNGLVYFADDGGRLIVLNASSGDPVLNMSTGVVERGSGALYKGILYYVSANNFTYALNASSGAQVWNKSVGGMTVGSVVSLLPSPVVHNDVLFFGTSNGVVYALNVSNGATLWSVNSDQTINSVPAFSDGRLFVSTRGPVFAFNASSGAQLWNFSAITEGFIASPMLFDGLLFIASKDNYTYAVNASSGVRVWNFTTRSHSSVGGSESSTAYRNGVVFYASGLDPNADLVALNASTGAHIWNVSSTPAFLSSPSISGELIFIGDQSSKFYIFNASSGAQVWSYLPNHAQSASTSSAAVANNMFFVGSEQNTFYAFGSDNESPRIVFESPTPASGSNVTVSSVLVNLSVNETNLKEVFFQWNGTPYVFYNDSLVLMFTFDPQYVSAGEQDTLSAAVDHSLYDHNVPSIGSGVSVDTSTFRFGGGAVNFDGSSNAFARVSTDLIDNSTRNSVTVAAWVYPVTTKQAGIVQLWDNMPNASWSLRQETNGTPAFHIHNTQTLGNQLAHNIYGLAPLPLNAWTFLVGSYNKTHIRLWVNGTLVSTFATNVTQLTDATEQQIDIGGDTFNGNFDGRIDEVRVWNRSFSNDEVNLMYYSNLRKVRKGQWTLEVNKTGLTPGSYVYNGTAKDVIGNYNHTPITNSVSFNDTVPPFLNVSAPVNASIFSTTNISVNFTASDPNLDKCYYSNTTGSVILISGCLNFSFISNTGLKNITVYANDSAGNVNLTTVFFNASPSIAVSLSVEAPTNGRYFSSSIDVNYTASGSTRDACFVRNVTGQFQIFSSCNNGSIQLGSQQGQINITMWANDTTPAYANQTVLIWGDSTNPSVADVRHDLTPTPGASILMQVNASDNLNLSYYIFSWNDTGSFANDSAVAVTGTSVVINVTKTVSSSANAMVGYRFYVYDKANNSVASSVGNFTVNASPSGPVNKRQAITGSNNTLIRSSFINETAPNQVTADSGNVTVLNLNANVSTIKWAAFVGNVTAGLKIGTSDGVLYDWGAANKSSGQIEAVFAAAESAFEFQTLRAANTSDVDLAFGFSVGDADSANKTFNHSKITIAGVVNVPVTNLNGFPESVITQGTCDTNSSLARQFWYSGIFAAGGIEGQNDRDLIAFGSRVNASGGFADGVQGLCSYENLTADYQVLVATNNTGGVLDHTKYYFYLQVR